MLAVPAHVGKWYFDQVPSGPPRVRPVSGSPPPQPVPRPVPDLTLLRQKSGAIVRSSIVRPTILRSLAMPEMYFRTSCGPRCLTGPLWAWLVFAFNFFRRGAFIARCLACIQYTIHLAGEP